MKIIKFIAHRQLTFSSDLYVNLNSITEIHKLYDDIINGSISTVNHKTVSKDISTEQTYFEIYDPILYKYYKMHIKKQKDGYWFRLTNYVNDQHILPGDLILINIEFIDSNCNISIQTRNFYKYVLLKHTKEEVYKVLSDNPLNDKLKTITENTNKYLENFSIIATNDNSLKWGSIKSYSYKTDFFSKKYIGVPYSTNQLCDDFDKIEEII
ncbi:hypothetical protein N5T79_10160 [Aliarcobacter cryaerophilus]|uniref:hypothetical protein n=1 Tax=Aliarcobacter cryaerophilus TaxID=28198 RepID=UPI0021B5D476|nr:hypothetical protein [Aliarcobacter cryaerophilus]MCT7529511.1 hypothetical protein [Aliarcobacter cryaerophilus]